jgi:polyhydroxyalkanoate synthesis repressor PhaR
VQPSVKGPDLSNSDDGLGNRPFSRVVFARCVSHLPNCLASAKNSGETIQYRAIRREREPHLADSKQANPVVTIKKYANRRLYNTATSAYVTLDHLAQMVRDRVDFVVFDAKSGDDITRSILTQIILEAESSGNNLLPVGFLRDIIRSYGDSVQGFLPSYLDLAMKSFTDSREQFSKSLNGGFDLSGPAELFQQAVRANMSMMAEAAKAFTGVVVPTALLRCRRASTSLTEHTAKARKLPVAVGEGANASSPPFPCDKPVAETLPAHQMPGLNNILRGTPYDYYF